MARCVWLLTLFLVAAGSSHPSFAQEMQSAQAGTKGSENPAARCNSFQDPANRQLCRGDLGRVVVDGGALAPSSYCLPITQQQASRIAFGTAVRVRGIAGCSMRWN